MNFPLFFEAKNSYKLFGLDKDFNFLVNLYKSNKLPKISLFSGSKGVGKSTLINHFLFSIFDTENYDLTNKSLSVTSNFFTQFKNNIFSNIIYIKGSNYKSVKVDDIRNLKKEVLHSSILNKDRFIILDDVELFNKNSLNALLKIIEEPNKRNYFILINNQTSPLLETIKSRSLEFKIILNENDRLSIIKELIDLFKIEIYLKPDQIRLSPGNYLKFNYILQEYQISLSQDFKKNLSQLLSLYKKNKNMIFVDIAYFIADHYINKLHDNKVLNNDKFFELKNYIFDNFNNFLLYNVSQNSLIKALENKLNYE
tara:strand:- start:623 stop:1558 length:936 start_codon:yes stop_codon:yes gene_type:complete